MAIDEWHEYAFLFLTLLTAWKLNEYYSQIHRRQPELKPAAVNVERSRLRAQQDIPILNQSKNNPGHRNHLTRSERRFRERQTQKQPQPGQWGKAGRGGSARKEAEPVNKDPAIKEISRMNKNGELRQESQESLIARLLRLLLHLLFHKLCIYIVFPFHVFFVFCHHLRICLRDSRLQDFEFEEDSNSGSGSNSDSDWETETEIE